MVDWDRLDGKEALEDAIVAEDGCSLSCAATTRCERSGRSKGKVQQAGERIIGSGSILPPLTTLVLREPVRFSRGQEAPVGPCVLTTRTLVVRVSCNFTGLCYN